MLDAPPVSARTRRLHLRSSVACGLALLAVASAAFAERGVRGVDEPPLRVLRVVVQEGDVPAGGTGAVTSLGPPYLNGQGEVGFVGATDDDPSPVPFLWRGEGIVWNGVGPFGDVSNAYLGDSRIGLSGERGFIQSLRLDGDRAIWTHLGPLFVEGDPAPAYGPGIVLADLDRATMLPDGTAYFVGGIDETDDGEADAQALYRVPDVSTGATELVFRTGDLVGGFPIGGPYSGIDKDYQISENGLHHVHVLSLETSPDVFDRVVYVDGEIVARRGDATGDGDVWQTFDFVTINNHGTYLFSGHTAADRTVNEYIAVGGEITIREGDTVDGVELAFDAPVRSLILNNRDQVIHTWDDAAEAGHAFFASRADRLVATSRLFLSAGDALDVDADGVADGTVVDPIALHPKESGVALTDDSILFMVMTLDLGDGPIEAIVELDLRLFVDGFESGTTAAWTSTVP